MEQGFYAQKYKQVEEIGRGSFGVAYLVIQKKSNSVYVSKKIFLQGKSQKEVESAYNEIGIQRKLDNPFLVKFVESFVIGNEIVMIMEYCQEGDLAHHIKLNRNLNKFFSEDYVINWFIQIALGLHYLHRNHIIHRDIKTNNIFLTSTGTIKIGDFGISKQLQQTKELVNTVIGTPLYMSPQILSDQNYGQKADVWALGCVLYQLCTLKHAFDPKNGSMFALFSKICKGEFDDINRENYSRELSDLIKSVLNPDPTLRPSIVQVINTPLIKNHINKFIGLKGKIASEFIPLKRTKLHQQIHNEVIKTQNSTQQILEYSKSISMSARQRMLQKKKEKVDEQAEVLKKAAQDAHKLKGASRQLKQMQLRGGIDNKFQFTESTIKSKFEQTTLNESKSFQKKTRKILDIDFPVASQNPVRVFNTVDERPIHSAGKYQIQKQIEKAEHKDLQVYNDVDDYYYLEEFQTYNEEEDEFIRLNPKADPDVILRQAVDEYTLCLTGVIDISKKLKESQASRLSCKAVVGDKFDKIYEFITGLKKSNYDMDKRLSLFKSTFGVQSLGHFFQVQKLICMEES